MTPALETPRLRLSAVTVDDAELMLAIWNDAAFIRNVADRGIRTIEEARAATAAGPVRMFEEHGFGPYALSLKSDATQIGICGLFQRDNLDKPDIGFAMLPAFVGRGYAGEAAQAIVDHARHTLRLPQLAAIVSPDNAASRGLLRKLGFSFKAKIRMPGDDVDIELHEMALKP